MAFAHATIRMLDTVRAIPQREFRVQFNPTEYSLNKSAQIAEINIPGLDSPIQQFVRGQTEKLTLDLFFDSTQDGMGDNAASMNKTQSSTKGGAAAIAHGQAHWIYQLVKIQPELHAPPRIEFLWGDLAFRAIVESVQRKYNLFSPVGNPLRATFTVTFREYKTLEEQLAELNLQSSDHTKAYVVKQGDTLSRIAAQEYRDPGAWRIIAEANGIDNPLQIQPGQMLQLPPLFV